MVKVTKKPTRIPMPTEKKITRRPGKNRKSSRQRRKEGVNTLKTFTPLDCPAEPTLRDNMRESYPRASMFISHMEEGQAKVDHCKDINVIQNPNGKLLVVFIKNTGKRFLETPPSWEGLAKMKTVMNNLIKDRHQHHSLAGRSYACGASKFFGRNKDGSTISHYKTNQEGKKLSDEELLLFKQPPGKEVHRQSVRGQETFCRANEHLEGDPGRDTGGQGNQYSFCSCNWCKEN